MKPLHVAVLMGGTSTERTVSLASGRMAVEALRRTGAVVTGIDVRGPDFALPGHMDVAFIAMHGAFGEDGHVQQILEDRGVRYTGSDAAASAVAFDKVLAKGCFVEAGIPTPEHVILNGDLSVLEEMDWPLVVKPARQGSSVGVHIVKDRASFTAASADARKYDGQVLVEHFVKGREFTVGILGQRALPVVEIRTARGFFGYEEKYTPGAAEEICPAEIEPVLAARMQNLARWAHECLGCRDVSRVDLMLSESGELYVLEVNTIPGMTANSLLPKAARAAGLEMEALCLQLVDMALARRGELVPA
jgi:D-alanine-D-alanine ligase